jgi:hypothetical protein
VALRKTSEERVQQAAAKEQRRREVEEQKRLEGIEKARQAFFRTPAGQARTAFERGDQIFQCSFDVMNQQAIIVAMVGSATSQRTSDPTAILNSVCHEGWELVNGSFVFVEQGQQSRDKFMSSGQNVATKGTTVGYYLFRRSDANRRPVSNPWEAEAASPAAIGPVTDDERRRILDAVDTTT